MSFVLALLAACAALLAACDAQFNHYQLGQKNRLPDPHNPLFCTSVKYGTVSEGTETTFPTEIIEPEIKKFEIDLPNRCLNSGRSRVGVMVKVCDDVRPVVTLSTPDRVIVTRVGSIKDYVPITVTLFCV